MTDTLARPAPRLTAILLAGAALACAIGARAAEPPAAPVNLLRNSTFKECSSDPRLPDNWGIYGNAMDTVKDWSFENYGIDEKAESPVPGTRAVKIWYPGADKIVPMKGGQGATFYFIQGVSATPRNPAIFPKGKYTMSVYLKAAREGTVVNVSQPWLGQTASWKIGTEWKRYICTSDNPCAIASLLVPDPDSKIWIAAPQLEAGTEATPYRPAPGEGGTPSPIPPPRRASSVKAESAPTLDGKLDDECWKKAQKLSDFSLPDGGKPSQQTETFIMHDDKNLYIAVRCLEPNLDKLRTAHTKRDSLVFLDDSLEIFISPTESPWPYYQFSVNPAGVQWDGTLLGLSAWSPDWTAKAGREPGAWTVEIAIPFSTFYPRKMDSTWRFNISRNRLPGDPAAESSTWTLKGWHDWKNYGYLTGLPSMDALNSQGDKYAGANLLDTVMASSREPLETYAEFDFYTDDPQARARTKWSRAEAATVKIKLAEAATGRIVNPSLAELKFDAPGTQDFAIPLKDLPVGKYDILAVAEKDGKEIAKAQDRLIKLPKNPIEVRLSRFTRGMVINGKPFMPVSLPMGSRPDLLTDWHLDMVRAAGFNCQLQYIGQISLATALNDAVPPEKVAQIRETLDRMHARGLKFIYPIIWSFSDWGDVKKITGGDIAKLNSACAKVVELFKSHPAVIGWYLMDEPLGNWDKICGFKESDLKLLRDAVRAADPYRPAFHNYNHAWTKEPYGGSACTDLVHHDDYCISEIPFDLELLVPNVRMINDWRAGRKPGFIFISGDYDALFVTPSPDAVRVHAWLELVYGSRGLAYFNHKPMNPNVWKTMQDFAREAVFLNANAFGPADARQQWLSTCNKRIHYSVWESNGKVYLFGVNTDTRSVPLEVNVAKIAGRNLSAAKRLFDGGALELKDGVLKDEFSPCGRRVYEFEPGARQGTP